MEWEESKENYIPLRQGRPAEVLAAQPATSNKKLTKDIEEERRALWEAIQSYQGEDPLQPWLRFIRWTQDTFASGGQKAELRTILEHCVRDKELLQRYRSDVRYLRVCVQYADCLPDPNDIFLYLQEHNIGQDFALFYEAYAAFLELKGNFGKADAIYQEGIARHARPVERLKQKQLAYEQRMARRIQRNACEEPLSASYEGGPLRNAFQSLAGGGRGGLRGNGRRQQQTPATSGPLVGNLIAQTGTSNVPLVVHQDDPQTGGVNDRHKDVNMQQLPTFLQLKKENTDKARMWTQARIKQKRALATGPGATLDVYVDDDGEDEEPAKHFHPTGFTTSTTDAGNKTDNQSGGCSTSALLALQSTQPTSCDASRSQGPRQNQDLAHPLPSTSGQGYDPSLLRGGDGEELSFEEVRARRWMSNRPQRRLLAAQSQPLNIAQPPSTSVAVASSLKVPRHLVDGGPEPTMTISTKEALNFMNSMFSSDIDLNTLQVGATATSFTAQGPEPTVTMSTRYAMDMMNQLFNQKLPHEASQQPPPLRTSRDQVHNGRGTSLPDERVTRSRAPGTATRHSTSSLYSASTTSTSTTVGAPATRKRLEMYEDTEFLDADHNPEMEARGNTVQSVSVYEDTEFITKEVSRVGLDGRPSSDRLPGCGPHRVLPVPPSLHVHEDTEFITSSAPSGHLSYAPSTREHERRAQAPPLPGVQVYEDTEFITRPVTRSVQAPPPAYLNVYEDTEFISGSGPGYPPALGIYEDTEFITRGAAPQGPLALPVYEDTEYIKGPLINEGGKSDGGPQPPRKAFCEGTENILNRICTQKPSEQREFSLARSFGGPCAASQAFLSDGPPGTPDKAGSSHQLPASGFACAQEDFTVLEDGTPIKRMYEERSQQWPQGVPPPSPDVEDGKENSKALGGKATGRILDTPTRKVALRPISDERALLLGVDVAPGVPEVKRTSSLSRVHRTLFL